MLQQVDAERLLRVLQVNLSAEPVCEHSLVRHELLLLFSRAFSGSVSLSLSRGINRGLGCTLGL